jgi:hypothetical protein
MNTSKPADDTFVQGLTHDRPLTARTPTGNPVTLRPIAHAVVDDAIERGIQDHMAATGMERPSAIRDLLRLGLAARGKKARPKSRAK